MDRQTQAVAEELVRRGLVSHSLAEEVAKVAISASDAKYVPELMAALVKVLNRAMVHDNEWYEEVAKAALAKLPQELRK